VKLQIQKKRIADRQKKEIMEKEESDKKVVMEVKMRETKIAEMRVQNRLNLILSKEHFKNQMN